MKGSSGKKAATQANSAANDNSPKKPRTQPKKERAFIYILQHPAKALQKTIFCVTLDYPVAGTTSRS